MLQMKLMEDALLAMQGRRGVSLSSRASHLNFPTHPFLLTCLTSLSPLPISQHLPRLNALNKASYSHTHLPSLKFSRNAFNINLLPSQPQPPSTNIHPTPPHPPVQTSPSNRYNTPKTSTNSLPRHSPRPLPNPRSHNCPLLRCSVQTLPQPTHNPSHKLSNDTLLSCYIHTFYANRGKVDWEGTFDSLSSRVGETIKK